MKKIFDLPKLSKKHKPSTDGQDSTGGEEDDYVLSQPSSPKSHHSPTKSPTKTSAPLKNSSASTSARAESPSSKSRPLRPFGRHSTDPGSSSSKKKKIDPDTHPLNLPPEQRSKRLSAMSARDAMDIDKEPVNGGTDSPASPQPSQPASQPPKPQHSKSFTVPVSDKADAAPAKNGTTTNGVNGTKQGESNGDLPVPPPHRSQPSSPAQTAAEDAETFKNDGNKYFKAKDYTKAIENYTKGKSTLT
jgi:DnaJ family protein C protein 7